MRALGREFEQKVLLVSVRWLVIILTLHFVVFSSLGSADFRLFNGVAYLFILSNLVLMVLPRRYFAEHRLGSWFLPADCALVALAIYLLHEPGTYYFVLVITLLVVIAWRRDYRWILLASLVLVAAYGAAAGFWFRNLPVYTDLGAFVQTAILFAVALFYFAALDLLQRNADLFRAVQRGKAEWERTVDSLDELIALVGPDNRIQRVNRALATRLETSPAELVGRPCFETVDGLDKTAGGSLDARLRESRQSVHAEISSQRLGGRFHAFAAPILEGDRLLGAVYILRQM